VFELRLEQIIIQDLANCSVGHLQYFTFQGRDEMDDYDRRNTQARALLIPP
jgi:hypothetical protein